MKDRICTSNCGYLGTLLLQIEVQTHSEIFKLYLCQEQMLKGTLKFVSVKHNIVMGVKFGYIYLEKMINL